MPFSFAVPLEAETQEILDAMASIAISELGPQGLIQAFGQDTPETYNGLGLTMMFFPSPSNNNSVVPRTQGATRAGYGQRTETHAIQGCLYIGSREQALPELLKAAYPWVRRVFNAFWLHQQLGGGVQSCEPVNWGYSANERWGEGYFLAIIFEWAVTVIVKQAPTGL